MTAIEVRAIARLRLWQHDRRAILRGAATNYQRQGWVQRRASEHDARQVRVIDFERTLEKLTPAHQALVLAVYVEGRGWEEVGAIFRMTPSTARYQSHRALERLALLLDKFDLM